MDYNHTTTTHIDIKNFVKLNYPKLFKFFSTGDYIGMSDFCIMMGMSSKNTHLLDYYLEQQFIIDNKHMHDLWML